MPNATPDINVSQTPARWAGRADLRVRFGSLLAIALLPLMLFTIWQSYGDYRRDVVLRERVVDEAAETAVAQIVETVDTAKAILRLTADLVTAENCEETLVQVMDVFPRLYNMAYATPEGEILCSSQPIRSDVPTRRAAAALNPAQPFFLDVLKFAQPVDGPQNTLLISHAGYDGDKRKPIVFAAYDLSELRNLKNQSILPSDVRVSIFARDGQIVIGQDDELNQLRRSWADLVQSEERVVLKRPDASGKIRRLTILPTKERELFIAVSAPTQNILSWNRINPWASAIVPLMAWLFGFAAIWLALENLVLSRLRRMRGNVRKFATHNVIPDFAQEQAPNDTIGALGDSFQNMAVRITDRERDLQSALDEKTHLLREIHHRVKNNLQVITSLLNMQRRQVRDPLYSQAIEDTRNRIIAISQVHKSLYESETNEEVDMSAFIGELTTRLARALDFIKRGVTLVVQVEASPVNADTATPLALFIVEAMTNAAKHGLRDGGRIDVSVFEENSETVVIVGDNGIGRAAAEARDNGTDVPELSTATGMGEILMSGFARQLGGTYTVERPKTGYACTLRYTRRTPA